METYLLHLRPLGLFDKWTKINVPRLLGKRPGQQARSERWHRLRIRCAAR